LTYLPVWSSLQIRGMIAVQTGRWYAYMGIGTELEDVVNARVTTHGENEWLSSIHMLTSNSFAIYAIATTIPPHHIRRLSVWRAPFTPVKS